MPSTPSDNFDFQNFYSTTLTSDITAGTLTIPVSQAPTPSEGILVIDPDSASPECIFYTSKGASSVTCPADGRGWESTTAAAHLSGTTVIMAPTAYQLRMLKTGSLFDAYATGWVNSTAPATVTCNGNRSYDLVISGVDLTDTLSAGMRLRTTRTSAAPTQCTSLNGTTQYYSRASASITGTLSTITDDITISAWVKPSSYALGGIASRITASNGWACRMNADGTVEVYGLNAAGANYRSVKTYQSLPLNKWTHISVSLDMSGFTTTTCKAMFDGVDVPVTLTQGGTNPTAWVNSGGDLNIGALAGASPFAGKIAQVWIGNANVSTITQSIVRGYMSQGVSGAETNCIFAVSFNNSKNDLNASANNLTANGSAVETNADSPFGGQADGTISSTLDYAIITKTAFSTNTTLTVQVPEGCTIPTTGGVSAVSYSTQKAPYLMPTSKNKWRLSSLLRTSSGTTSNATYGAFQSGGWALNCQVGEWDIGWTAGQVYNATNTSVTFNISSTALTGLTLTTGNNASPYARAIQSPSAAFMSASMHVSQPQSLTTASTYVMYTLGSTASAAIEAHQALAEIFAELTLL